MLSLIACAESQLRLQQVIGLLDVEQVVLEGRAPNAFGLQLHITPLQAAVRLGQAVLQDAFEARFGVALPAATALVLFGASFAAAQSVVKEEASEAQGGGDDATRAEGVPEEVRVHGSCVSASWRPRCLTR
jgi:hypothetical protein